MQKIAIVTDSNSGITQAQSKQLGVWVLPMPFYINDELFLEDITLTQEQFYDYLAQGADVKTSQPAPGDVTELWDTLLKDYDAVVHIPMSSGLSSSCETADAGPGLRRKGTGGQQPAHLRHPAPVGDGRQGHGGEGLDGSGN